MTHSMIRGPGDSSINKNYYDFIIVCLENSGN